MEEGGYIQIHPSSQHPRGRSSKTCRQDIKRVIDNPSHIPRWQSIPVHESVCCVEGCSEAVFSSLQRSITEIDAAVQLLELKLAATPTPIPTPLCKHHYHTVYNQIQWNPSERTCLGPTVLSFVEGLSFLRGRTKKASNV